MENSLKTFVVGKSEGLEFARPASQPFRSDLILGRKSSPVGVGAVNGEIDGELFTHRQ
jgi:hypothetical protein